VPDRHGGLRWSALLIAGIDPAGPQRTHDGPAFAKPYLKSKKNERNDAEAICEAVQRPSMHFVSAKTPEQQAVLHLHHGRWLLVRQRVALSNHMRGVLSDYGIVLPQGLKVISRRLPALLEDADNALPMMPRHLLAELKAVHDQLIERIERFEQLLKAWRANNSSASQRLAGIPGIGVLTATAFAATLGGAGRQTWPSTGRLPGSGAPLRPLRAAGKRLLGISRRCDGYLRGLLIHGARDVIHHSRRRLKAGRPGGYAWVEQLLERCHVNEAAVALAKKMARTAWVLVARNESYCPMRPA
jgi:transposase